MLYSELLNELIVEERQRAAERVSPHLLEAVRLDAEAHPGLRGAMAGALVRIGLCLDDAAVRRVALHNR